MLFLLLSRAQSLRYNHIGFCVSPVFEVLYVNQKYIFRQTLTPIGRKYSEKDIKEVVSVKFLYKKLFFRKNEKHFLTFGLRPAYRSKFQKVKAGLRPMRFFKKSVLKK